MTYHLDPNQCRRAGPQQYLCSDTRRIPPDPGFTYAVLAHGDGYFETDSYHIWPTKMPHHAMSTPRARDGSKHWALDGRQWSPGDAWHARRNSSGGRGSSSTESECEPPESIEVRGKGQGSSAAESKCEPPESIEVKGKVLLIELELSASLALDAVAEVSGSTAIKGAIRSARLYLSCPSGSSLSASLALHEVSEAISEVDGKNVEDSPQVREPLVDAEKALRDVVVCRCQLATEFGVRELFVRELQRVFDYTRLDSDGASKLMHSHRQMFGDWPGVFQSTNASRRPAPRIGR